MPPPVLHADVEAQILRLIREDWGRILSALVASFGDFAMAEDALQEAVVAALKTWPKTGLPDAPAAWVTTAARHNALDHLRRQSTRTAKEDELAHWLEIHREDDLSEVGAIPDQRLEMIFTCCHPALDEKSRVALTLRALGGLSTEEIARAFVDQTTTMAARLTRAKKKLAAAGIGFKLPEPEDMPVRIEGVLQVIYLIYNEGSFSSNGENSRVELIDEAIRLGRILTHLLPEHAEAKGLLALMLLGDSRRAARCTPTGAYVPLSAQNRARWDRGKISAGRKLVEEALRQGKSGPYAVQAAISLLHAQADDFDRTDWPQIVALYAYLGQIAPNPIIIVNQAVALSYADSPQAGLSLLDSVSGEEKLSRYQPYFSCRADLLARAGRLDEAIEAYKMAISLSPSDAQIAFLEQRMNDLRVP